MLDWGPRSRLAWWAPLKHLAVYAEDAVKGMGAQQVRVLASTTAYYRM